MRSSSPGADWFVRALVRRLAALRKGEFAILWVDVPLQFGGAPPYVRVSHGGNQVLLEVSANDHLDEACRLSMDDEIGLLEFGFHPPVGALPDFWLVGAPDDAARFAALTSTVLAEILDVTDTCTIGYDGGTGREPSSSVLLPAPVSLLHHDGSLTVWVDYDAAGDLEISGRHLGGRRGAGACSYVLTVAAEEFPRLHGALGAPDGTDARALLTANGPAIVAAGERAWLDAHAIPYRRHHRVEH